MFGLKWVSAIVVAVGLIVYGSFAAYEGSWSLTKSITQHQLQVQRQVANGQAQNAQAGWNYQSTLGEQITKGIDSVTQDSTSISSAQAQGLNDYAKQLKAQREADANTVCDDATRINGVLPAGMFQTKWINANCADGSLKPSSVYYYNGN